MSINIFFLNQNLMLYLRFFYFEFFFPNKLKLFCLNLSWMVIFNENKKKNLYIFFIFFFFILKKINWFFFNFNVFFLFKIKFFLFYFNNFFFKFHIFKENESFLNQPFEKFSSNFGDSVKIKKKSYYFIKNHFKFSFFNSTFNRKFYYKFLNFFFLNSFLPTNSFFPRTGFFYLFFFKGSKGSPYLININKVLNRWTDFFNLILNIFLLNIDFLLYSSPFFKNETLSLNWNSTIWDITSWRYTYPHFIFKTNYFSIKTNFFYKKLKKYDYDLLIISDCLYHFKNLYFFKKNYFYTIGLVSLNINPWLVSYPIIASSNSFLNQIFFLQSLIYAKKKSSLLTFFFFKKLWNYSFF